MYNQTDFDHFILSNNIIGFFEQPITTKSGRQTHFYVNWRIGVEDAFLTDKLVSFVLDFIKEKNIEVDTFYGVPEGATKLGVLTQFMYAKTSDSFAKGSHSLAMGRAKPKEHGVPKDRLFVGKPVGKVLVIEDVTTTGLSLSNTIQSLIEAGVDICGVLALTNRMEKRENGQSVKEFIEDMGFPYYQMSDALTLLPQLFEIQHPSNDIIEKILAEFKDHGVEELTYDRE